METYVGLHKGNKAGEVKDGIAREMMGLEFVKIKELPEEVRSRKTETTLEMSGKDYVLSGFWRRFHLATRKPAKHLLRYPPGAVKPVDFRLVYIGTYPSSAGDCAGSLARAACLLTFSGSGLGSRGGGTHPVDLGLEPVGSSAVVAVAGRFGRIGFGRHTGKSVQIYSQTGFSRSTRSQRSTSKRKNKGKEEINTLTA